METVALTAVIFIGRNFRMTSNFCVIPNNEGSMANQHNYGDLTMGGNEYARKRNTQSSKEQHQRPDLEQRSFNASRKTIRCRSHCRDTNMIS